MLNITNHQGNANQNHNEISPHTCQNGYHQKTKWNRKPNKKTPTNKKCWWGCGLNGTPVLCWWDCRLVQPPWKTVWSFLKKLKIELLYDPAISLMGICLKWVFSWTTMFTAALFTIAKLGKQPKCPSIDKWIKKMWYMYVYIHTHTHTYWENLWRIYSKLWMIAQYDGGEGKKEGRWSYRE